MPRSTGSCYTDEFKAEAAQLVRSSRERFIRQLVYELGIADQQLRNWITKSGPSGRWHWEVGSCRVAGGDGTLAKVDFGAPRRRRPRTPAPPKPPKRCTYQRPGPGPRPPLARRAG